MERDNIVELTEDALLSIEKVDVSEEVVSRFSSEREFTMLSNKLLAEAAAYANLAAGTTGRERFWDRDHAAVGGNMVRLSKLLEAVIDEVDRDRGLTTFILARLVFETLVNIRYLMKNFSPELVSKYVRHSFRHERRLRDAIQGNIDARSGIMLPIEDRMLQSIDRAATVAGIDLGEIDLKGPRDWDGKNLFEKAKAVGLDEAFYRAAFAGPSHDVHGNWQTIYGNHLDWEADEGFAPNREWKGVRPQVLEAMTQLAAETTDHYFFFMCGEEVSNIVHPHLYELYEGSIMLRQSHEKYLAGKTWPEI